MTTQQTETAILQALAEIRNGKAKMTPWHWLITVMPIVLVIMASTWGIAVRLGQVENQVITLQKFADKGDRFTLRDWAAAEKRIEALKTRVVKAETWITNAPPVWFRQQFIDLKSEVSKLKEIIIELKVTLRQLSRENRDLKKEAREHWDGESD